MSNPYQDEKRIKQLAILYKGSSFKEEYVEELYGLLKLLSGKIARKYHKLYDSDTLDELEHTIATTIIMRLKQGVIKPDMAAWTRYIMVVVKFSLKVQKELTVEDDVSIDSVRDNESIEVYKDINRSISVDSQARSCIEYGKTIMPFNDTGTKNLLIYLGVLSAFDKTVDINNVVPKRCAILLGLLKHDITSKLKNV